MLQNDTDYAILLRLRKRVGAPNFAFTKNFLFGLGKMPLTKHPLFLINVILHGCNDGLTSLEDSF